MCKKTDMQSVKEEAVRFLDMPIEKATHIAHPFTDSYVYARMDSASRELKIDYLEPGTDSYENWHSHWLKQINESQNPIDIFLLMRKEFRLSFFKKVKDYLSKKDFGEFLTEAWMAMENPNSNPDVGRRESLDYFNQCNRVNLMNPEEMSAYNDLPDRCVIYRGVTTLNLEDYDALSWTLSAEKAEWFARRFTEKGLVYRAWIDKSNILAYFQRRQEDEVIVDPEWLEDIEIYATFDLDDEDVSFIEGIL